MCPTESEAKLSAPEVEAGSPHSTVDEEPLPKSNSEDGHYDYLIWTGPRATDISDCEKGLFDGSITLYGQYPEKLDGRKLWSLESIDYFINNNLGKMDEEGRLVPPNSSFCDSPFNLSGEGKRINHNRSDMKEGDLFVLSEQIRLIRKVWGGGNPVKSNQKDHNRIWFMAYNQNFVGRHGNEDQYMLLAAILALEEMCETDEYNEMFESLTTADDDIEKARETLKNAKRVTEDDRFSYDLLDKAIEVGSEESLVKEASIDFLTFWIKTKKLEDTLDKEDKAKKGFCLNILSDWKIKFDTDVTAKAVSLYKKLKGECLKDLRESVDYVAGKTGTINQMKILSEAIVQCAICLNPNETMMNTLDSKNEFRDLCKRHQIPTTENIVVEENGEDCSLSYFSSYRKCNSFVIQKTHSSGGYGTYVYSMPAEGKSDGERREEEAKTDTKIKNDLRNCSKGDLILSEYRDPSISVNVHCILSENDTLISPASVQIIINIDGKLMYSGADFIAYQKYAENNPEAHHMLMMYCEWLCGTLSRNGYRGVIGFDVLISKDYGVEFVEANNRFQASTCLLNKALRNLMFKQINGRLARRYDGKPITRSYRYPSVQLLNLMAFYGSEAYKYDGEDTKANSDRKKILDEMILEYGKRLCPQSIETTKRSGKKGKGSDDAKRVHSPMLPSEFRNIPIPYSMIIYYDNMNRHISGFDHYKHIRECESAIVYESDIRYQMACIKERYRLAKQTGKMLERANGQYPKLTPNLQEYFPTLDCKYSEDGLTAKHIVNAKTATNRINGLFLNIGYRSDIPELCNEIIDGISAIEAWRYGTCLDTMTFFCDCVHLKNNTDDASCDDWKSKEFDLWNKMYERHESRLLLETDENIPQFNVPDDLFKEVGKLIGYLDIELGRVLEDARSDLHNDQEDNIRSTIRKAGDELHNQLKKIIALEIGEIRFAKNQFSRFKDIKLEKISDGIAIQDGMTGPELSFNWGNDAKSNRKRDAENQLPTGSFLDGFYSIVTENPLSKDNTCRVYKGDVSDDIDENRFDEGSFISKVLFHRNICSTNLDRVVIHPNLEPPRDDWDDKILNTNGADLLALKIGLINNGVRLTEEVSKTWDAKPGVNSSVDLNLTYHKTEENKDVILPINCAYNNSITIFSPYTLEKTETEGSYTVKYYDKDILVPTDKPSPAVLQRYDVNQDIVGITKTHGVPLSSIAFLATDRIRYQHNDGCMFNAVGKGCKFCEFTAQLPGSKCTRFDELDIMEAISATLDMREDPNRPERHFDHILIGGGTLDNRMHKATERIIAMISQIRNIWIEKNRAKAIEVIRDSLAGRDEDTVKEVIARVEDILNTKNERTVDAVIELMKNTLDGKDKAAADAVIDQIKGILAPRIYLMCVPPEDLDDLERLKANGVTEISFNLETYSRTVARKIMPGKSGISRSTYIAALTRAVRIWEKPSELQNKGNVRSALILGLEDVNSTQEGVRVLTSLGVSPILSIFRPVKGTELEWIMPLSSPELYEIYGQASRTCRDAGLRLGPSCIYCQNNTLAIPDDLDPFQKGVRS